MMRTMLYLIAGAFLGVTPLLAQLGTIRGQISDPTENSPVLFQGPIYMLWAPPEAQFRTGKEVSSCKFPQVPIPCR